MKKTVAYLLLFVVLFLSFAPTTFAGSAQQNIDISLGISANTVDDTGYRRINYTITNYGKAVGIKTSLYLDGAPIMPESPNYIILFNQRQGSVDVYMPSLDTDETHDIVLKVTCSNGYSKEEKITFSALSQKQIGLRFMHCPESVDIGADIPLAIEVTMPEQENVYSLETVIRLNGEICPDVGRIQPVTSGQIIYFVIPGEYTNDDLVKLNLKITANPNSMLGEPTGSLEIDIPMTGPAAQIHNVMSQINPVIVTAYVTRDTSAYDYGSLTGYRTTIPKGTYVAYLNPDNHNSMRAAKVRTQSGAVYWVPMSNIWISNENYTIADTLTKEQKEYFVNTKGYTSKTPYLIWVNLERQILCVFTGSQGNWQLVGCFPVASGKNTTPTPTVEHEIEYVTRWVTPTYTCYPVLALYDGYAIHNQPVSPSGYVTDSTIGKPASAGCVRMLQKDIDWVHATVPVKTNVVIY